MNVHHDQGIEYGKIDYKYFPPSLEHNVHLERKEYDYQDKKQTQGLLGINLMRRAL